MRVLIVDDEEEFAAALERALQRASFAVDVVHDGDSALEAAGVNDYDLVVLDRDLPGTHGDDVARILSTVDGPRILMLTAADRPRDKVDGFALGADDYLTKPFHLEELIARLLALSRRPKQSDPPALTAADLVLDPFRRTVTRGGHPLELSRKEFAVLHVLLSARGGVVSAETLLEKAWDENANPFTNSIRMTVSTLRKKLGSPLIQTVNGAGYKIDGAEDGVA